MAPRSEDYEAQQQQLREQHGLDEEADVHIDVKIPEVNPEIFKDVEPILFRGFLTLPATINGESFVFKSLNHHEFEWLAMTHPLNTLEGIQRYYSMFLAYGVALAGDVNVLKDRDERLPELAEFFSTLPKQAHQRVVQHLSEVNRRASRAMILVEPYVMESRSRLRWIQSKGLDVSSTAVTGFEGTQALGLNWGQLMWRALNHLEDLRENAEREWENAKFVASSMAGKGMQRIYSADRRRRQEAKTEQVDRREKVIRYALFNEPLEGAKGNQTVIVARTVTELTDQLERDLKGEKDWHDRVIEDHENRVSRAAEQRARTIQEVRAAHIREYGDRPVFVGTDMTGLTHTEVEKRIRERRAQIADGLASRAKYPELTDPKYGEFAEKWLQKPIVRNSPSVMPTTPNPRSRATPFRRDS